MSDNEKAQKIIALSNELTLIHEKLSVLLTEPVPGDAVAFDFSPTGNKCEICYDDTPGLIFELRNSAIKYLEGRREMTIALIKLITND